MAILAEVTPGVVFMLLVVAATTCVLLMRTQRHLGRRPSTAAPRSLVRPKRVEPQRQEEGQPPLHLDRWEVRMHELARDLSAQLDSKMSILQHLMELADQQAVRLESLLAQAGSTRTDGAHNELPLPRTARTVSHVATQAAGLGLAAEPRAPARALVGSGAAAGHRHDRVYALADAGYASHEIAAELGHPIGEVELILSLREDA